MISRAQCSGVTRCCAICNARAMSWKLLLVSGCKACTERSRAAGSFLSWHHMATTPTSRSQASTLRPYASNASSKLPPPRKQLAAKGASVGAGKWSSSRGTARRLDPGYTSGDVGHCCFASGACIDITLHCSTQIIAALHPACKCLQLDRFHRGRALW